MKNPESISRSPSTVIETLKTVATKTLTSLGLTGILLAGMAAEDIAEPTGVAYAVESGGYPDYMKPCVAPNDPDRGKTSGTSYWCDGYQWGDLTTGDTTSPRRYAYRNCTDFAAWYASSTTGRDISGLSHATLWDNRAPNIGLSVRPNGQRPEIGDIAQWEGNDANPSQGYGHVAIVTAVNADGSANIAEYNYRRDGNYGTRNNVRASHYIDFNGPNNSAPVPSSVIPPSADFNGDRYSDIALFRGSGAGFVLARGANNGFTELGVHLTGWGTPAWGGVGDFNGDRRSDVAFFRGNGAGFVLARGSENGFTESGVHLTGWGTPAWGGSGDFNGDQMADIAFFRGNGAGFVLARGSTNGFTESGIHLRGWGQPDWGGVGDFNGDNMADIAFFNRNSGVALALGARDGFREAGRHLINWAYPEWAGVGDFNGDTYDDIAFFNQGAGFAIARGQPNGTFVEGGRFLAHWGTPEWGGVGDYNRDNYDDVVFLNTGAGFAYAQGASGGFTEAGRHLTGWGTPAWGGGGAFPNSNGNGFPHQ